ncbi:lipase member H [Osmerus eperlanus]|uniref:lipase member H n=1 Tax=Osmerus eperlanus TaxID=29151 RepID=UPI002E12BCE4
MLLWWFLVLPLLGTIQICKARGCDEFTDLDLHHAFIGTSLEVRLLLYTRENSTCGQQLSHHNLSAQPQFNLSRPTTLVIHGYRPSGSPPVWLSDLTQQLLSTADMNVLVVDWNSGATNFNYFKAVENTRVAADNITGFIRDMRNHGASLSTIHMVGVSLGAHMSGFVGANFNGKIGRITALDPAGPQFTGTDPEDRLDPTDAQFVDVLHTDMDALGFRKPLGHIDFYANGGADQPGCPKTIFSGGSYFKCDHQRSVFLYLESLKRTCPIRAFPCPSYTDFQDGHCMDCQQFNTSGCPIFGYDVLKWKDALVNLPQSKVFFTTNEVSPFCQMTYKVEIVTWNQETRWCFLTIKLHSGSKEAKATINHKASKFEKYTTTQLLAQFDENLENIQKISVKMSTRNVFKPKRKLRVLRIRLTDLERKDRPLCRYDLVLKENIEVTFRPIPCEDSNF